MARGVNVALAVDELLSVAVLRMGIMDPDLFNGRSDLLYTFKIVCLSTEPVEALYGRIVHQY